MYRILEITSSTGNIKYRLNNNSGLYNQLNSAGEIITTAEPRGIWDIVLGGTAYKISKLQRTSDNAIFEIGTRLTATSTVVTVSFKKNVIMINGNITLADARIYVEPVINIPALAANARGRKVNNFIELQASIEADNRPIKLGNKTNLFTHPNPNETLGDFIKNFILTYNMNNDTCYADSGRVQTEAGKRRSLADIYMICKFYYPTCNLHDIIHLLYVVLPTPNGFNRLGSLICETIHKRVWWNYGSLRFSHDTDSDEYGHARQWYLDKLTATPVYEGAEETTGTRTNDLLIKIKKAFAPGKKFKGMSNGKTITVDSTDFYDGVKTIILIQRDGSRKMVYDKVNNVQAKLVG